MSNLTEQWKNKDLDEGFYFIKLIDDNNIFPDKLYDDRYGCGYGFSYFDEDIENVIAKCDYNEYQKLQLENNKLKELLRECQDYLENEFYYDLNEMAGELKIKIQSAIGESEVEDAKI